MRHVFALFVADIVLRTKRARPRGSVLAFAPSYDELRQATFVIDMADYQWRDSFYQSVLFSAEFFPHDTWVVTNDSLDNNMAFHAPHRLDLAPQRVYDAPCDERFEGFR